MVPSCFVQIIEPFQYVVTAELSPPQYRLRVNHPPKVIKFAEAAAFETVIDLAYLHAETTIETEFKNYDQLTERHHYRKGRDRLNRAPEHADFSTQFSFNSHHLTKPKKTEKYMSTDYCAIPAIHLDTFFDGRLKKFGLDIVPDKTCADRPSSGYITDGNHCLHYVYPEGTAFGIIFNGSCRILLTVAEAYDVRIVSEHSHEFWGFETEEEFDLWHIEQAKKHEDEFYNDILKFVRGEEHNLRPGSVGMGTAEMAKKLIAECPELLAEDRRADLFKAAEEKHDSENASIVLTEDDLEDLKKLFIKKATQDS